MKKNDEVLARLMSIETTNEEIYKELIKLQKDSKDRKLDNFRLQTLVEDIFAFIKLINYEKNVSEKLENKEKI